MLTLTVCTGWPLQERFITVSRETTCTWCPVPSCILWHVGKGNGEWIELFNSSCWQFISSETIQLNRGRIEEVNVNGTQNVIDGRYNEEHFSNPPLHVHFSDNLGSKVIMILLMPTVCIECGVSRLVYTSTYNVVFAGQEIKNGDHLDILPDSKVSACLVWSQQCGPMIHWLVVSMYSM